MKSGSFLRGLFVGVASLAVAFLGTPPKAEASVSSTTPLYLQHAKEFSLHAATNGHGAAFDMTAHASHSSHVSHSSHESHSSHVSHYSSR